MREADAMPSYRAPVEDTLFLLNDVLAIHRYDNLPGFSDASADVVEAVLNEGGKLAAEIFSPLNLSGDQEGCTRREDGSVATPKGFKAAYDAYAAGGWMGLSVPEEFGGQGLPHVLNTAMQEFVSGANLALGMYPGLTQGAVAALLVHGSDEQKKTYLPKMVEGAWTGTMNLTEPHCGTDLGLLKTKAVPNGDGSYSLTGTKIFISAGEHDLSENIVHLVIARIEGAPMGTKGISLFVVPKFLVNADGSLGERNDAHCVSIEHKLGIKASPTAVLQFGDHGGAIGTLVGEENRGLEYMFIMMNAARFGVGMQGVGLAERAYQQAVAFAKERVQSREVAGSPGPVAIINHPDVRRMLMSMRAQTEAARALAYVGAALSDIAHNHADQATRKANLAVYEYLVPIIKGWSTEMSENVARDGVQVHGGMGFIEETGAAQHYRDAKILTIYEGTTAIQANDLVGRKTVRDGGAVARSLIEQVRAVEAQLGEVQGEEFAAIRRQLALGSTALEQVVDFVVANAKSDVRAVFAGSVLYLKLAGIVLGGWQMARAALVAQKKLAAGEGDASFLRAKIATARFFADHVLSSAPGLRTAIVEGAPGVLALEVDQF
jgi:alkylation response protein AidB-like acyl-CoA dehydrogenase